MVEEIGEPLLSAVLMQMLDVVDEEDPSHQGENSIEEEAIINGTLQLINHASAPPNHPQAEEEDDDGYGSQEEEPPSAI